LEKSFSTQTELLKNTFAKGIGILGEKKATKKSGFFDL